MLPDVHDEDRVETGNISVFVQRHPVIAEAPARTILKANAQPTPRIFPTLIKSVFYRS